MRINCNFLRIIIYTSTLSNEDNPQRVDEWLKSMDLITNLKKGKTENV